ncbi:MAG: hypothetical protein Kow0040_01990 [Thermogutta sp.]
MLRRPKLPEWTLKRFGRRLGGFVNRCGHASRGHARNILHQQRLRQSLGIAGEKDLSGGVQHTEQPGMDRRGNRRRYKQRGR